MKAGSLLVLTVVMPVLFPASGARAQQAQDEAPVTLALFPTSASEAKLQKLAQTLDQVVLGALGEIDRVKVTTRPPMDLQSTQLALDCIGATNACLRGVAEHAAAEAIVAPSLERSGDQTVVTILYFDARGEGALRSATRRHSGKNVERTALDAVPAMLRELYGIAEPAPAAGTQEAPQAVSDQEPQEPEAAKNYFPIVPVIITASGVAFLGVGIAFGLMANASEDELAELEIDDEDDVAQANATLEEGQTRALIANIGLGVGAAVIAVGAAMWIVELSDDDEEAAWLAPRLGPGHVGLALGGRFEGAGL